MQQLSHLYKNSPKKEFTDLPTVVDISNKLMVAEQVCCY